MVSDVNITSGSSNQLANKLKAVIESMEQIPSSSINPIEDKSVIFQKSEASLSFKDAKEAFTAFRILELGAITSEFLTLKRLLELTFKGFCRINLYYTKKEASGLGIHSDDCPIIILQLNGRKKWTFPDLEKSITTQTGDLIIIPKGTKHEATTELDSTHLAISIQPLSLENLTLNSYSLPLTPVGSTSSAITPDKISYALKEYKQNLCFKRSRLTRTNTTAFSSELKYKFNWPGVLWLELEEDTLVITSINKQGKLIDSFYSGKARAFIEELYNSEPRSLKQKLKLTNLEQLKAIAILKDLYTKNIIIGDAID